MAQYYPVYLDLRGRLCVIIGGGEVAERKIQNLLECGATLTVVSPDATTTIQDRAARGELKWEARQYGDGDLKGAFLAIAATDREAVNKAITYEAAREGVLLNVVDNPALCSFIAPSVIRRGDVVVALSTGGASPALARKIRESLEGSDVLEYAHLAGVLSRARRELKRRGVEVDPNRWQGCINAELVDLVKAGNEEEAFQRLLRELMETGSERAKAIS